MINIFLFRLQGKSVATPVRRGREGDKSFLALSSSSTASQCHCPCMGLSSSNCLARWGDSAVSQSYSKH